MILLAKSSGSACPRSLPVRCCLRHPAPTTADAPPPRGAPMRPAACACPAASVRPTRSDPDDVVDGHCPQTTCPGSGGWPQCVYGAALVRRAAARALQPLPARRCTACGTTSSSGLPRHGPAPSTRTVTRISEVEGPATPGAIQESEGSGRPQARTQGSAGQPPRLSPGSSRSFLLRVPGHSSREHWEGIGDSDW